MTHPTILAESLTHIEGIELAPEIAGYPAAVRHHPAHRRLAKAKRIPPEIAAEMERFALDWEMVEGGAHEVGSGGEGGRTREEVMTGAIARVERALARVGIFAIRRVIVPTCVECRPAWETARDLGYAGPVETDREQRAAREWLDDRLPPLLAQMTGIPLEGPAR